MRYVDEVTAEKARGLARRLQELPADAGVLFVAIAAAPTEGGRTNVFDVCVGISVKFELSLGLSLIRKVFEKELETKEVIFRNVDVYRGVSGAALERGDQRDEAARPH